MDGGFSSSAETYVLSNRPYQNKGIYCFRKFCVPVSEYKSSLTLTFPQNFLRLHFFFKSLNIWLRTQSDLVLFKVNFSKIFILGNRTIGCTLFIDQNQNFFKWDKQRCRVFKSSLYLCKTLKSGLGKFLEIFYPFQHWEIIYNQGEIFSKYKMTIKVFNSFNSLLE